MGAQRLNRVELPRQFGLGQRCVDLVVTDLVEQNARTLRAAFQTRDQVVFRLPHIRRDGAAAKGADRICHFLARENDIFCPAKASIGPVQA